MTFPPLTSKSPLDPSRPPVQAGLLLASLILAAWAWNQTIQLGEEPILDERGGTKQIALFLEGEFSCHSTTSVILVLDHKNRFDFPKTGRYSPWLDIGF